MNQEKRWKERFKKDMAERVDLIQRYINNANEQFVNYNKNSSLDDCLNLKNAIDNFYETKHTQVQVNRFSSDTFEVFMLKDFKTVYPKQYKKIIKNSKKNGIDVNAMIDIRDELNLKIELKKEELNKKEKVEPIKKTASKNLEEAFEK